MSTPLSKRFHIEWMASLYLEAVEAEDFPAQERLWQEAEKDEDLVAAFRQVHEDLLTEGEERETQTVREHITEAVERHLPSASIDKPSTGPVTVADVAAELFQHPPERLTAEAHALNARLRQSTEALPDNLGLSKLIVWAESKFGSAPAEYWKAFRNAALKLELVRSAETEYALAARSVKKPGDKK